MAARPPKRPKPSLETTQGLLNIGGISRDGLSDLLKRLHAAPTLPGSSLKELDAAYHDRFLKVRAEIPIELTDGEIFKWEFADPALLLQLVLESSPLLAAQYTRTLQGHPAAWGIIFAWDEFTPGNKLQVDNRRKVMNASFNFVTLGSDVLASDATWMTCIAVRHSIVASSKCGWSGMLAVFLKYFLYGPRGICTAGVPFTVDGEVFLLSGRMSNMLSDGDGIRMAFNWKGASGTKPCFRHWNIFASGSDLAPRDPNFVTVSCHEPHRFQTWTPRALVTWWT
jgi:hypothetical protein